MSPEAAAVRGAGKAVVPKAGVSGAGPRLANREHAAAAASPAPLVSLGNEGWLKDAVILEVRDDAPDATGEFRRVSLVRTPLKYPLVRLEQVIRRDGHLNEEHVVRQVAAVADHLVVKTQPGLDEAAVAELAQKHGGRIRRKLRTPDTFLVEIAAGNLDALPDSVSRFSTEKALVKYAEPDYVVHALTTPNDASFAQLWGLHNTGQTGGAPGADIHAPEAWTITQGNSQIVVALIDTGADYNHPDLAQNIWSNPGEISGNGVDDDNNGYLDDVRGWNFVTDNNNPMDDHFHGTHCAGTIGAAGNNNIGVTGVNWQVKIIPLKFLSSSGGGMLSDAVDAVRYATHAGARLISNSWGGGGYSQSLKDAIDDAAAAGILFVAAAGNDSSDNDATPSYPASYSSANVLAVAATDHTDRIAGFSNYGRTSVHLAAPGVGIFSTFPTVATAAMTSYGLPTSYARISGTSMATPHVAGAAALALAQNPGLSMSELRTRLIQRTDRLAGLADLVSASGRLNVFNLVDPAWVPSPAQLQATSFSLADSEGNGDGYPNPGEIVSVTPRLLNIGGVAATGVTLQLVSNNPSATVLTSSVAVGTVNPIVPVTPASPFRIQLSSTLADNAEVVFDLIVHGAGLADGHVPYSLVVTKTRSTARVTLNFAAGEMKADPVRDLVYLLNRSDRRVMALDTGTGLIAAIGTLAGSVKINPPVENGSLLTGQLAISRDGTKLYVALSESKAIQTFSLPDLTPLTAFQFDFEPESMVCAANGRLYCSSTDYWGQIREINTSTGAVTKSFDKGTGNGAYYMHSLLRMNLAGTRLFIGETGLWTVGGPTFIDEYDVSVAGSPVLVKRHPYAQVYMKDFAIDELQQRIYSANGGQIGGIYGIELTDLVNDSYGATWPLGIYAVATAFLPNEAVIYGGSVSNIRKFRRSDGLLLADYSTGGSGSLPPRGVVITPNGNLVYVTTDLSGGAGAIGGTVYRLGIIGRNSLVINNPPPTATPPAMNLSGVDFNDSEGNKNSTPNPGEIIQLNPQLINNGGTTATNVSISITSNTAGLTVLGSSSALLGSVPVGARANPAAPFRVQIGAGVVNGTVATFTFTVLWDGLGATKTFTYSLTVKTSTVTFEAVPAFQIGEILADRVRNFVYMIDKRYLRLLQFDTNSGHFVKAVALAGPKTVAGAPSAPGQLAQSIDGSRLYVALKKAKMIEVFSLPDLAPLGTWSYTFEPVALACDAGGRLYATSTSTAQKLIQVDTTTGTVLGNTGASFGPNAILRGNAAGTKLFASLDYATSVYEYDVSGTAPVQLKVHATAYGSIDDFEIDETNNRLYLTSGYPYGVRVFDMSGVTAEQLWTFGGPPYASAVALLPGGTEVLGASGDSTNGNIRRFQRSNGTPLGDYTVGTNSYAVMKRGIAITPNGRAVYVKSLGSSSPDYPVDNSLHTIGMIGGSAIAADIPGSQPVQLTAVTVSDPATNTPPGNNNGYPNPGETFQLSPTLKNVGEFQLAGVSVQLLSADGLATVQAPSTVSAGNLASYASFTPASPFKVVLSAALKDGQPVRFTWRVTYDSGTEQLLAYTIYASNPAIGETQANFAIGAMIADRTRNLAYVIDQTNQKLLAIDTELGTVAARAPLVATPSTGQMTLSTDGTRLYVPLSTAKKVQVFALPSLESANIFDLDFQPSSLAACSDGRLYASAIATPNQYLRQIDPDSGAVLGQFGKSTYPASTILRASGDGTLLYVNSVSGLKVDEYAISTSGLPVYQQDYELNVSSAKDFVIDETYRRILATSGGVYGLQSSEMDTGLSGLLWPFNAPYGVGICFLPGDAFIYGGSGGATDGRIRRFRRDTGQAVSDFIVTVASGNTGNLIDRGLVITQNGRIVYAKSKFTGSSTPPSYAGYQYWLGVIGRSSLTLNTPNQSPLANAGADRTVFLSTPLQLAATISDDTSSPTAKWTAVKGPGSAAFTDTAAATATVNFSTPGLYKLRVTATDALLLTGSDEINVTVLPDPPAVSVTASVPKAREYGPTPGEFTFTRTGPSAASLTVNFTIGGTATAGSDYAAMPLTITIPAGAASAKLSVTPIPHAVLVSDKTVVAILTTSLAYDPGVSTDANVVIRNRSFANWMTDSLGGLPPADQLPLADSDHDGFSNLLEYALKMNPRVPDSVSGPAVGVSDLIGGQRYLTLTFRRLLPPRDVTYAVEVSDTLAGWDSPPGATVEQSATANGDGTETVVVRDTVPMTPDSRRFLRLRVTWQ